MKTRLLFSLFITAICAVLVWLGAPEGIMLAGGGPCVIIIYEGNAAYGAIEGWADESEPSSSTKKVLARLKAAITASCQLTSYGSLYKEIENHELAGPVLTKISDFHRAVVRYFQDGHGDSFDILNEAQKLERYNRRLANVIADETVYSEGA